MTIAVGDRLPAATFRITNAQGARTVTTSDIFAGRRVVLVGMPGAFTPTCTNNHLPGYVENIGTLRARGVDEVIVLAVNDHHVMRAWEQASGAEGKLTFLPDGNGDFVKAMGLEIDMSGGGMGVRSKRFSMLVEDGVVRALNLEDNPGQAETSGAARMLEAV